MVNRGWIFVVLSMMMVFAASDALALVPYVSEGPDTCCSNGSSVKNASSVHRVGALVLDGVAADKPAAQCSLKPGCGKNAHNEVCPLAGPFILVGAVANDIGYLLTMPFKETERLN